MQDQIFRLWLLLIFFCQLFFHCMLNYFFQTLRCLDNCMVRFDTWFSNVSIRVWNITALVFNGFVIMVPQVFKFFIEVSFLSLMYSMVWLVRSLYFWYPRGLHLCWWWLFYSFSFAVIWLIRFSRWRRFSISLSVFSKGAIFSSLVPALTASSLLQHSFHNLIGMIALCSSQTAEFDMPAILCICSVLFFHKCRTSSSLRHDLLYIL